MSLEALSIVAENTICCYTEAPLFKTQSEVQAIRSVWLLRIGGQRTNAGSAAPQLVNASVPLNWPSVSWFCGTYRRNE